MGRSQAGKRNSRHNGQLPIWGLTPGGRLRLPNRATDSAAAFCSSQASAATWQDTMDRPDAYHTHPFMGF
jgi:hypothetical protein